MSKAILKGHTNGSGSVTLEAPNTDSDVVLELPSTSGVLGGGGVDYNETTDPAIDTNPGKDGAVWVNNTSGEVFVCTDTTTDANIWIGQGDTSITPAQQYGVSWNQSTDTYGSLGDHTGLPIQSEMKRCLLNDDGTVAAYLLSTDSTILAGGGAATLDGSAGQVMVEIPKFWYKHTFTGDTHTWEISTGAADGYSVHPAFIKNGVEVPFRYMSAYEGFVSGSVMSSVSGQCPTTSQTRAAVRTYASNRGTGWRQWDYTLMNAIQLLYLVEYQDFNTQETIGMGRTELSGSWSCDSLIGHSGKSNGDGNGTNSVAGNTNNAYMTYRGIENWYGSIWKWVDGVNINDRQFYISNDDSVWADDTASNYTSIGTAHNANGYQNTLVNTSDGFLPASVGAGSSTKLGDYYWQSTGWRVVHSGGGAGSGATAGGFSLDANRDSATSRVSLGGRLAF